MDRAQEIESELLALQKPMNDIIDRGDSTIQQFYSNSTVFVTGCSGFIGKQLIEKLFRSCKIKKLYMLLRRKGGKSIQERLQSILKDPVYESLYKKQPQFADRIVPVEGDAADIRLGLTDTDWAMLANEVNIIFHVAATVRFDEPIKMAVLTNVRGTRETLSLARECKEFKCFNYTSTAFAHTTISRINTDVEEVFYPCPVPPDVIIKMVETVDEKKLNAITANLIEGWPNTYTFTKAIAEELIRSTTDYPVCVVRPPIVFPALTEPSPGWVDYNTCFSSSIGAILGLGLGIIHVFLTKLEVATYYSPVDFVNNAIIAACWDACESKKDDKQAAVYTLAAKDYAIPLKTFSSSLRREDYTRIVSPKTVWYISCIETSNVWFFWILTWLFHYIPAYFIDTLLDIFGARPKGIPRLVKVYTKVYNLSLIYKYFSFNFWNLKDDNCQAMIQRMSPEDRAIFNFDMRKVDITNFIKVCCIGIRKYIVKDGLQGSDVGYSRQKHLFKYIHYIVSALYMYLIYTALYTMYLIFKFIVQSVF